MRTAYIDTKDKVTGEPEFNNGLIKGNEAFEYILPGDFIVTEKNQNGIVISIKKTNPEIYYPSMWRLVMES